MKSILSMKNLIAVGLILFGLFFALQSSPDTVIDEEEIAILDIKEPTTEILELVRPISSLITDPTDRAKLAIFNQEFANRILKYKADNQETNDVYVLAASYFFNGSLKDKYDGLDSKIVELLRSTIGEDNHILSADEKIDISNKFMGLAWSLIQKQ